MAAKRTQYASPFARRRSLEYTWMFTHAYMQHMLLLTAAVAPQCASSHILASLAAQQAGGQSVRCKYSGTATGPVMLSANNHHTIVSPHGVGMHFLPIRNYRFSWCLPPAAANSCSAMVSMLLCCMFACAFLIHSTWSICVQSVLCPCRMPKPLLEAAPSTALLLQKHGLFMGILVAS